jgi:porin
MRHYLQAQATTKPISSRPWRLAVPLLGSTLAALLGNAPAKADDSIAQAAKTTDCSQYDKYRLRGSETAIITTCDTISPDWGGARKSMIDDGWLVQNYSSVNESYDFNHADSNARQAYSGQRPTFQANSNFTITYDLSRLGFFGQNAQLGAQLTWYQNSYLGNGLRGAWVNQLSIEQEFDNRRVRLEYGFYSIGAKFYGAVLGTSTAASALGPNSGLLYEAGVVIGGFKPTPAFDLRLYSANLRFYNHFGMARSSSPRGFQYDSQENPSGLSLSVPGARALYIDEAGYRAMPQADRFASWIRVGGVYNTSDYMNYKLGTWTTGNHMVYAAYTQQYTQPDASNPVRGVYTDIKVDQAPSIHNVYDQDALFSLYSIGPFNSRPYDMATFGYQYKWISPWARQTLARKTGLQPIRSSETYTLSYAFHVMRGLYFNNSLSYTDHPVLVPQHEATLVWMSTLYFSF